MGGDAEQRVLAGPCWVGESATSWVCFLPLASGLAAGTCQAGWGCLAVESSLWGLRSSSRVGLVREPDCSDINKKICCGLCNSQHKPQSGFFPVVDVDVRVPHPPAALLGQLSDLSVLSQSSGAPQFTERAGAFAEWDLIKSSLSSLPPHPGAS